MVLSASQVGARLLPDSIFYKPLQGRLPQLSTLSTGSSRAQEAVLQVNTQLLESNACLDIRAHEFLSCKIRYFKRSNQIVKESY